MYMYVIISIYGVLIVYSHVLQQHLRNSIIFHKLILCCSISHYIQSSSVLAQVPWHGAMATIVLSHWD